MNLLVRLPVSNVIRSCTVIRLNSAMAANMKTTLFDNISPDISNLKVGAPGTPILLKSAELVKNAAQKVMSSPDAPDWLNYGAMLGAVSFRTELAKFLSRHYRTPVDKDSLIQTTGATSGLHVIPSLLFGPGDIVFTERLSYFLAPKLFLNGLRLNIQPVDIDTKGMSPDALEKSIESHSESFKRWNETKPRPYWAMLYLQPTFHNPTGHSLSPENCERIIKLARKYHLLVLCDDVYDVLYFPDCFTDGPPRRLFTYDNKSDPDYQGNVVSNGTFAKIFGPGIRLGWLEAPDKFIDIYTKSLILLSSGAANHMTSGLMTSIMADGHLDELVEFAKKLNQENCRALCSTLKSVVPGVKIDEPRGGYFAWFRLPEGFPLTAQDFAARCLSEVKIAVVAGNLSSSAPTPEDDKYIRVSFSYYSKEQLQDAATRLGNFINSIM